MKEELRILNVLGQVDEKYVEEAAPGRKAKKTSGWIKWGAIAACVAILAATALPFLQHDPGSLVPNGEDDPPAGSQTPGNVTLPAAISANGLHLVQLAYTAQAEPEISTDFIIHINSEMYTSWEENGVYEIRPQIPMSADFPECSLQIRRVADKTPAAVAESMREELAASYLQVGDIAGSDAIDGLFIHADNGSEWDAEQVDVTVTDDLLGGSYVLIARYFTEATEGHGVRFADMTGTFKAVTSADTEAMPAYLAALDKTVSEFYPAFFSGRTSQLGEMLTPDAQICTYGVDVSDEVGIASIDYNISGGESPTAAIVSVKHRISTEDSYNYLTIELTYAGNGADGKWIIHFAGIEK